MFKGSRWRSDKNRIVAVFKFQFHATQVSEFGGNGMVISVVPADNGKPTAKLEKCVTRENCCFWENSVCETVKFIQDPKSGNIHEKIYYFIVSAGSPKGSLVGEFSVNIADYLEATKGCSVSFPFKKSISNSHLHVLIQRIPESDNQRHLGDYEVEEKSLRQHLGEGDDVQEGVETNYIGDEPLRKTISHMPGLSGTHKGSSGSDITLSSSESSCGLNTPGEPGVRHNNGNIDESPNGSSYQDEQRTRWDLAIVPVNGANADFSLNSPRYVFTSDSKSQNGLDESVEKLKANLVALSRKAEVSEIELQSLRKQIVKESKKGQDLLREVASLKEERDALKDECKKLKASRQFTGDLSKLQCKEDPWTLLEKIQEELNYEKGVNANLQVQLQKTQESNADLLLAVQDAEETSKKNNKPQRTNPLSCNGSVVQSEESIINFSSDDEEQRALEELVKQHSDAQETYLLEQKVMDLCSELEMYRRDKDELEMQMEQLALDYEILKQENHEFSTKLELCHQVQMKVQYDSPSSYATIVELEAQRETLQYELSERSRELSDCLATMKELEACKEDLEKQVDGCKAEKEAAVHSCTEQGQRAARAEAALSQSTATVNKLEAEMQKLKTDLKKQLQELSRCFTTMHCLETQRHNLEDELLKQAQEFQADIEALSRAKTEHEQRALEAEKALACSKTTISELNRKITKLENELKTRSEESAGTMAKFEELEAHIQNLEEEIDKQVEGFEADLEAVTEAKVEQEKRAIRAEEALRLMKWKNVSTAARIQDEFKRLSLEMQSSFKSNEKLVIRALAESSELRLQNRHLRNMLQKANKELHSARHDYDSKIQELNDQVNLKSIKLEQMVVEFEEKCEHFQGQINHIDELQESVFLQHLELRGDLDRVDTENELLTQQAKQGEKAKVEPERIKPLSKERDLYAVEDNMEGDVLEGTNTPIKVDGKDEMEHVTLDMCCEAEILRAECENLKHSLYEDELEKEKLRKQVFQLKADLKKKEDVIASIEKKYKEGSIRVLVQDRSKTTSKSTKSESLQRGAREAGAKEVATLKETIKLLEGNIKSKESALEISTNAFLAKERNLNGKIVELESRLGEVTQSSCPPSSRSLVEEKISAGMQADNLTEPVTSASDVPEVNNVDSQAQDRGFGVKSNEEQKFDILLKEMVLLKERNNSMESELKEMQERYSNMSVKFAEVEGERQKLVMALRNVKNAKKS